MRFIAPVVLILVGVVFLSLFIYMVYESTRECDDE